MYALVTNDAIQSLGGLPRSARRLDTGEWVLGLRDASVALQEACGYYLVVETTEPAPSDPATMVVEGSVELVAGVPTRVWSERAKTSAELQAEAEATNRSTIEANLDSDLTAMQAIIDDTNANINSSPASRIKDLARAMRRIIKHDLNDFTTSE